MVLSLRSLLGSRGRTSLSLLCVGLVVGAAAAACGMEEPSEFKDEDPAAGLDGGPGTSGFGGQGDGKGKGSVKALVLDPPEAVLTVDGKTPGKASFTLRATMLDGRVAEVAPESLQFDRPDLASGLPTSPIVMTASGAFAGTGVIHAIYKGSEATAKLTVIVKARDLNGVDPAVVAALDGAALPADPSLTSLRYPYDKTVFPLGLDAPLLMWDAPVAGDVYRLHLEQANYTYDLYAPVAAAGQLRIPQQVWDRMTSSNGGGALSLTLSRWDAAAKVAYTSAKETWTIAPASLRGAIYYWTASKVGAVEDGHLAKIRPGTGAQPEVLGGGKCMGCHAVSADGSTLAAAVEAAPTGDPASYPYTTGWSSTRAWASFDLPSGALRKQTTMYGANLALTPDGKYTVFGGKAMVTGGSPVPGSKYLTLADTKAGTVVVQSGLDDVMLPGDGGMMMPSFSPNGKKLGVVEAKGSIANLRENQNPDSQSILVLDFDQATLKFAPAFAKLPTGDFSPYAPSGIGYPTFAPSSTWLAFHVGNRSTGCFQDGANFCDNLVRHKGNLYAQKLDGSGPVRLSALNDAPAEIDRNLSVEPTFNPVERGGYAWVVFTSMRDWGNKLTGEANNGKRRLWVAAVDKAIGAVDPSHPAFYLEGQEESPNMRGFWALAACTPTPKPGAGGGACKAGFECCSGFCDADVGKCVEPSALACVGLGGQCKVAADCCNAGTVTCENGKCSADSSPR